MTGAIDMRMQDISPNSFCTYMERISSNKYKSFSCSLHNTQRDYLDGIREISITPGLTVVVTRNILPDNTPKNFYFNESPIVLSISLSGCGQLVFTAPLKKEIKISSNDLYIGYTPDSKGTTASFGDKHHNNVMLICDPKLLNDLFGPNAAISLTSALAGASAASSPNALPDTAPNTLPNTLSDQPQGKLPFCAAGMPAPPHALALAERIFHSSPENQAYELFIGSAGIELLCTILSHLQPKQKTPAVSVTQGDIGKFNKIRQILVAKEANPPSLRELCRSVGMSESKLKRGFKQVFGISVFGYLQRQRVMNAYLAIVNEGKNVSECAWDAGYTNVSHFIATFKRHFGVTPGDIMRGHRITLSSKFDYND